MGNKREDWHLIVGSVRDYQWDCRGLQAVVGPEGPGRSSLCTKHHILFWVDRLPFTWKAGVSSYLLPSSWLSMLIKKSVVLKVGNVQGGQFAVKRDFSAGGKCKAETTCAWSYMSEEQTIKDTWCWLHQYSADCLEMSSCTKPDAVIRVDNPSRQPERQEWRQENVQ